jgi:hypothetical protein
MSSNPDLDCDKKCFMSWLGVKDVLQFGENGPKICIDTTKPGRVRVKVIVDKDIKVTREKTLE